MANDKASSALLARIAEAALKEFNQDDLYVAQAPAGVVLGDAQLDLLEQLEQDRLKDPASVGQLVELSQVVDCIQLSPNEFKRPDQDPNYLSDVFPLVMKDVEFLAAPMSDADRKKYEQAQAIMYADPPFIKTSAYADFCILRAELEKKEVARTEMQQNLKNMAASDEKTVLESQLADLTQLLKEQQDELEALDRAHNFRTAESIVDNAERQIDTVPASVTKALDTIEIFQITNPANNVTHVACSFFPSHLSEDNWIPLKLTPADIAGRSGDGGNPPDDIDDNDIESIELEIQTLVCERPWLWPALFNNRHWNWRTSSRPISTGDPASSDPGLIPAYIHGLIFARNLTVKCKPSAPPKMKTMQMHLATMAIKPTASFLMRAIQPKMQAKIAMAAAPKAHAVSLAPRAAPAVSRSAVTAAVVRARPVGPAVTALKNVRLRPAVSTTAKRVVVRDHRTGAATVVRDHRRGIPNPRLVLRPGILIKLAARGRVVDEQGRGVYQAMVDLKTGTSVRRVTSGTDGSFTFTTLAPGRYAVKVTKAGFNAVQGSITVPQTTPLTINMRQIASCRVQVRIMERVEGSQRPFAGSAKAFIETGGRRRIESMDGRSEAIFSLPPGNHTITVTSPAAQKISPPSARVQLSAGRQPQPTLTFTIDRAVTLSNPETQVLGFLCRRIPLSPNPEHTAGTGG